MSIQEYDESTRCVKDFRHLGYRCIVLLVRGKHHCGYVQVPATNVLYEKGYDTLLPDLLPELNDNSEIPDNPLVALMAAVHVGTGTAQATQRLDCHIRVHGGLTFGDRLIDFEGWYFGFDCSHYGDADHPDYVAYKRQKYPELSWLSSDDGVFRSVDYVADQCRRLAEQLIKFDGGPKNVCK